MCVLGFPHLGLLVRIVVNASRSRRYTPLSVRFRRMAWISRTVFEPEETEEKKGEDLKEEPEDAIEPIKKREKKFLAAPSAYELLKLFYV